MADKVIKVRECDVPKCGTPDDDVKRIESTLEGEGTVVIDLCAFHRAPVMELRGYAHRKARRRGITITRPEDFRKS